MREDSPMPFEQGCFDLCLLCATHFGAPTGLRIQLVDRRWVHVGAIESQPAPIASLSKEQVVVGRRIVVNTAAEVCRVLFDVALNRDPLKQRIVLCEPVHDPRFRILGTGTEMVSDVLLQQLPAGLVI